MLESEMEELLVEHFQFRCRALAGGRASVRSRARKQAVLDRKSETALGQGGIEPAAS